MLPGEQIADQEMETAMNIHADVFVTSKGLADRAETAKFNDSEAICLGDLIVYADVTRLSADELRLLAAVYEAGAYRLTLAATEREVQSTLVTA